VIFIPENGIDVAKFAPKVRERNQLLPLKLCYVGRLVPYKCPDLVITGAAKLLKAGLATLDIVGDGPMMGEIKALVAELGLEACVTFHGWVDQAEVARIAAQCELFLFPSVREFGGGAVLEAMALGLVPIVLDYGGPGEIVTAETGFKVDMRDRVMIIRDIEALLDQLAHGEVSFKDMAGRGLERVAALYTWEKKADQIVAVYDWVRGNGGGKPEFGF
jgi:glycosyltransferase involved in cell wall biosynthesis